jgi:glyoxylase-like metal-dependent hydrolase (beta-lactamase superfamily II)
MNQEIHCFNVGDFKCILVNDGYFAYPQPARVFFANAPPELLAKALREQGLEPEHWDQYVSPYSCLIIQTAQQQILVDTGAGQLAPTTGRLTANMRSARITPEDIGTVILTHAHPDHIGGAVNGNGKPAFPRARHVMWKAEWDFWSSGADLSRLRLPGEIKSEITACAEKNLPLIERQLHLIDQETDIIPGVRAIFAPGHTPGHLALTIASKGDRLLCVADALLLPLHIAHPTWHAAVDFDPEQVARTRYKLLEMTEAKKTLVFAFHFPFPGLGSVSREKEIWEWISLNT